jgi:MFS-type transporter involved in bile tolerance (Atg22 family)
MGATATAIYGVLGLMVVLLVGLWLLLQVKPGQGASYSAS